MANPNPEDPNVPKEGVPKEDPHHLLDYDEEEDPEMDIEKEEPEEADDEPEAEEADDEPEAEEADDEPEVEEAGDELEAEGADVELEAEEPDGVPEATIGTGSQRPFTVRDFPMGFYATGESSTACDQQFVGGLAPWALRRDLEALRRHERIREAESETSRTEIAFLGSEAKIRKMERFYLEMVRKGVVPKPPYDDEGSVCPRKMPKKSDEDEGLSDPRGPLIGADGPGGASGSGGAGGSGGTGGNADGTGVRGTGPTVPK
nr:hypothetical protein [Tanacetum cinerariifolium]